MKGAQLEQSPVLQCTISKSEMPRAQCGQEQHTAKGYRISPFPLEVSHRPCRNPWFHTISEREQYRAGHRRSIFRPAVSR